jgi:hypothetical protein
MNCGKKKISSISSLSFKNIQCAFHGYKIIHNFLGTIHGDLQFDKYDLSGYFWNPYKYWM